MAHRDRHGDSETGKSRYHYHYHYHERYKNYSSNRRQGYGINLYRNTRDKKIGGVCAGLADHFEISHWVMRVLFITALVFTGTVAIWAYVIGWVLMAPKKPDSVETMEYDENQRCYRKKNVFRYGETTSERIKRARQRMEDMSRRVGEMEEYITSKRYKLDKEFSKLQDEGV